MIYRAYLLLLAMVLAPSGIGQAQTGELVDRIVATVNKHIVLQSDWEDAVYYEAFIAGRPSGSPDTAIWKSALDRLIDQELLREQMHSADFQRASDEEIAKRLQEVRQLYPNAATEEAWKATLTHYGLNQDELRKRVALQINLMRLVDAHLRPGVNIDQKTIESYYNQELLPQLRQSGTQKATLAEVAPKIKELLTQQKMDQLLAAWLQNLRAGSDIRTTFTSPDLRNQAQ
jgi:parvulin-like peptidyl-prolyl isomerase